MKKRMLTCLLVLVLAAALFCAPASAAQTSSADGAAVMSYEAHDYLVNYLKSNGELYNTTYMVILTSNGQLSNPPSPFAPGDGLSMTVLVCYDTSDRQLYVQATEDFDAEIATMYIPESAIAPFMEELAVGSTGKVIGTAYVRRDYTADDIVSFSSTGLSGDAKSSMEIYNSALIAGILDGLNQLLAQGGMGLKDLSLTSVFSNDTPFADVRKNDYFYAPIVWAVDKGITQGTSPTTFSPYDTCTRAHVVTFLWRAAGSPTPKSGSNPFVDVNVNDYYGKAVLWAVEKGITQGMDATHFAPNAGCTRAQVVTFLQRYMNGKASGSKNPFTDVASSAYYYNAVLWAVEKGITQGMTATTFGPDSTCTRGQIVTFLYRAAGSPAV
ncbi:MAG: S-layer homology domain-containing protein [Oscillospiraceae bacterium]|nr:S-layer homology domain-containing protein [Oscillospiraceae bacterium]